MSRKKSSSAGSNRLTAVISLGPARGTWRRKILGSQAIGKGRSTTRVAETGGGLVIRITAKDAAALRAAINSALKDLQVIQSVSALE